MGEPVLREPRQERSRVTRQRLLEAAVSCLAELGWAGSTVGLVAHRAGVSRGAAQHHFPTREELFGAAVEYMAEIRSAEIRARLAQPPSAVSRTELVVDAMVQMYAGPLFRAALQLWAAASSDAALKERVVPLEVRVGRVAHRTAVELLEVDESKPGAREAVQATLDLARGLGLANLLTDDGKRRARVVREWARMLDRELAEAGTRPG
ncbi:TetR family transcriptional regulator [Tamaricihabitans halophyticus]|uniref:TetR family transcriptional regulator n=1 Tax=Tamaricihabitans halophyticus TaxID=1262583 RepID=A0A4R2Q1P2_9PSEU|nr:TetR/AcrR family transcriptional regulator [Tamaricihabitans halophyticus]TCP41644.1 TetR family transcriptional regulator [Tamaricihabitans halophyticus]